jgi:DNA-directed RNA polymerase specialized sigma24 family protein
MSDFAATRWTLVAQARGNDTESKAALSELCDAYYKPVVAFLACEGRTPDAARELAHEFFAIILGGKSLGGAERGRGRFRSYLLGAVKHFLADHREKANAEKRGGGVENVPLDTATAAGLRLPAEADDDRRFDRQWALAIVARALETVGAELRDAGKAAHFLVLKPWLMGDGGAQSVAATQLGISEGAVKVSIHRLRQRFRDAVKAEVAQTVPDEGDVEDELRHLLAVLLARPS